MKTLILILTLTIGYSQYSEWDTTEVPSLMHHNSDANTTVFYQNFTVINLLALYQEYEIENIDTIRAVPFEDDFLINHGSYKEWVSERQLEDRGYRFKYRLVIGTDPFVLEYIFIKQNTLPGFMEFLERKGTQ